MTTITDTRPAARTMPQVVAAARLTPAEMSAMLDRVLALSPESVTAGMRAAVEQLCAGLRELPAQPATPSVSAIAPAPTMDNGLVHLTVHTPGSARLVVLFVRALSQHSQVRFARMDGSARDNEVEILLSLTAPVPLAALLQDMPGVRSVRVTPKTGASPTRVAVALAHAGAAMQAA